MRGHKKEEEEEDEYLLLARKWKVVDWMYIDIH
jgi:hypothetical protein